MLCSAVPARRCLLTHGQHPQRLAAPPATRSTTARLRLVLRSPAAAATQTLCLIRLERAWYSRCGAGLSPGFATQLPCLYSGARLLCFAASLCWGLRTAPGCGAAAAAAAEPTGPARRSNTSSSQQSLRRPRRCMAWGAHILDRGRAAARRHPPRAVEPRLAGGVAGPERVWLAPHPDGSAARRAPVSGAALQRASVQTPC